MNTRLSLVAAGLGVVLLAGCGPKIRFADSIDGKFDLALTLPYDDRLASPYVAGADFTIYVYDRTDANSLDGWSLVSSDPEVLDITSFEIIVDATDENDNSKSDVLRAEVVATGAGSVTLEVYDEHGEFVRGTEVEVMQPDRMELRAAGPMFIERDDLAGPLSGSPAMIAGGTATFLVEWFAGSQRLSGAGTLELSSNYPQALGLWERQSFFDEDREWAQLSFDAPQPDNQPGSEIATVGFSANGSLVGLVDFRVVSSSEIAVVDLIGENIGDAKEGELMAVLAQALDAQGQPIWGVAFDWDIDGRQESGEGDLFRYWFEPAASSVLGAQFEGHRGEIIIPGDEGFVASSNDINCLCSTQHDRPTRGLALSLSCLFALALVRRRRDA